jgi:hypothetical protein
MDRTSETFSIDNLRHAFGTIEFPEYQREPTVWNREQKQRLIDSMFRGFDIAAIYLYVREDDTWECIDGRQRLNAVMSFLGQNEADEKDNGFSLRITNEVADDDPDELVRLDGMCFAELDPADQRTILEYEMTTVLLSAARTTNEFNLQFLRLNLGTLINAGEKLNAMVGAMRDLLFDSDRLGKHPFLAQVGVPTRRFARELIAAQIMLQVSTKAERQEFARARHFDLQRYVKEHSDAADPHVGEVSDTLDALQENAPDLSARLGNRAISVSVVLAAWELQVRDDPALATQFAEFMEVFLDQLADQVGRMKRFDVDPRYPYLVEFQRHLTQAAVEKPAIAYRHRTLLEQFSAWQDTGELTRRDAADEG